MKNEKDLDQDIVNDPDTFAPDTAWFARAKIVMPKTKEMISLRLDPDVLEWFRKTGHGYQTRINAVLKSFVESNSQR
ncbi:MAG: BrnA antitoxin family protein [Bdellovibrionales bacterium]